MLDTDPMSAEGGSVILADNQPVTTDAPLLSGMRMLKHDVSEEERWREIADIVRRDFGRLDVLVNNAGIVMFGPVERTTHAEWSRIMAVNVDSVFLGCKAMLPLLRDGGRHHPGGASLINLSSVLGMIGVADEMAFSVSKTAVRQAARSQSNGRSLVITSVQTPSIGHHPHDVARAQC